MLTKFSLWLLHVASYGIAYVLLAVEIVILGMVGSPDAELNLIEKIASVVTAKSFILSVLVILSLFSAIYTFRVRRWRNNGRIRFTVTNDSTYEMGAMLASNILPLVTIGFNTYVALIVFGMIWILGIAVVRAGYIHICPVFLLNGYHLYADDKGRHVLAKMKKETFNLYIRDNIDGIEVRQLSEKLYIVCDR